MKLPRAPPPCSSKQPGRHKHEYTAYVPVYRCCVRDVYSYIVLDVLTPLSDSRQEAVENVERRISGASCMCWMDFHDAILCCGFLCARLISFLFCRLSIFRLPRQGLPHPIYTTRATTPLPPLHNYHACVYIPATTPRATTPHTYHRGLSRLCIHPGYHTRAITLHHTSYIGLSHPP